MRRTYKEADKVLVLDSNITQRSSTSLGAVEMVARLRTSSWVRRLWTFHEAYLAQELHYQFEDVAISLSEMRDRFHHERCVELHGDCYEAGMQRDPFDETAQSSHAYPDRLSDGTKFGIEMANIIWNEAFSFLRNVEVTGKFEPQEHHKRLKSIIHPLRWRTTSRMKDETICLSGCLDRTVEDLDKTDSEYERMKLFLGSMKSVPAGLMFVDRLRIEEDGFRWMPISLLSGGMGSTLPNPWAGGEFIGHPTPSGLIVTLPGILLQDIHKYIKEFRGGHVHEIVFLKIAGVSYFVYGLLSKPIVWDDYVGMKLAIILSGNLDTRGTFGALVSLQDRSRDIISCKLLVCTMVMGNPQLHCNLEGTVFSKAFLTEDNQRWCVG